MDNATYHVRVLWKWWYNTYKSFSSVPDTKWVLNVCHYDLAIFLEQSYMYITMVKCLMRGKECIGNRKGEATGLILGLCSLSPPAVDHSTCLMILSLSYLLFLPSTRLWAKWRKHALFILLSLEPNTVPGNTCSLNIC